MQFTDLETKCLMLAMDKNAPEGEVAAAAAKFIHSLRKRYPSGHELLKDFLASGATTFTGDDIVRAATGWGMGGMGNTATQRAAQNAWQQAQQSPRGRGWNERQAAPPQQEEKVYATPEEAIAAAKAADAQNISEFMRKFFEEFMK